MANKSATKIYQTPKGWMVETNDRHDYILSGPYTWFNAVAVKRRVDEIDALTDEMIEAEDQPSNIISFHQR